MYIIEIAFDTEMLKRTFDENSWYDAINIISEELDNYGFTKRSGLTWHGDSDKNSVDCVLAMVHLSEKYPWFMPSVTSASMYRVEEISDLLPAIIK